MTREDFLKEWLWMAFADSDCILTALLWEGRERNH